MSLSSLSLRLDDEHVLRPVRTGDGAALASAYALNRDHLAPWEPSRSPEFFTAGWQERNVGECVQDAAAGRSLRLVIESVDGQIQGRVNLNNIVRGAFLSADLGYWVASSQVRRGLATRSVGLIAAIARDELGLHRLQAATLVHNTSSQRVLAANGFSRIGLAPRYLKIAGEWQDHVLFQSLLTAD